MQRHISSRISALTFGILVLSFLVAFYVVAWQEPTQAPPAGNVAAPLNSGVTGQSKSGGLILNTGGAGVGLIIQSGNVGIGITAPSQKLEVNGGNIKISGGNYGIIANNGYYMINQADATTLNIGSGGGWISGIKFYPGSASEAMTITNSGNVGIGTINPGQKLEVIGTIKADGFLLPTAAGAGKVLTSDASGVGSWQPAPVAPDTFGGSTLVNYGNYSSGYSVSNCPDGWTEAGLGAGEVTYTISGGGWAQGTQIPVITESSLRPAYRTCFRTDRACLTLVIHGSYACCGYYSGYAINSCPAGWTEAGLGYQPPNIMRPAVWPGNSSYPAFRTCFLCQ